MRKPATKSKNPVMKKTESTRSKATRAPTLDVVDVKDIVSHRSFVIYGRSGSGKTTLSSTFPTPMLYVNIRDNGTDSIADVKGIKVFNIEDTDDLEDLKMFLLHDKGKTYKTLVLDTMSQLQEVFVEEVIAKKKVNLKGKNPGDWGTMQKGDWGEVASKLKALIIELRDLPMEVVFIAQDRTFNMDDEDGDNQLMPEIGPRLMPSVVGVLNAAVSVVGCTFVKRKIITKKSSKSNKKIQVEKFSYCLRLGPNPVFVTKVRKPRSTQAPDFIEDPTYDDIIAVIEGEY